VKSAEEIMQILEAFDLTKSFRDAGELAGCSPNTVAHHVARRDAGELTGTAARRPQLIDEYLPKLEEWMEASKGKIRADVAHEKLRAMGYGGSERTTRRAVAAARRAWLAGNRRVHRPWVPEPGLWRLCGTPHRRQYAAPATMWREGREAECAGGERGRGVGIVAARSS
jgi:hypothetical protein